MLLPGKSIIQRRIIQGLRSSSQIQPCGIDLSLRRVLQWTNSGIVDFDNMRRKAASTEDLPFSDSDSVHLSIGAYLLEFNEKVETPLDVIGQIFVRSSLFRSGATVNAGVMDAGYNGAIGAMLQVSNPHGITLHRDAKLAQIVFHELQEKVEGYSGIYQKSDKI
ncbi:deoxyuridine 5'-triphosphate nucleotidohydrolase [Hysterangium stoloniferum]|nr:deoxyuridine 5'-triphosphate nucleotidohydrolase [Hysterangium stoloniferum]